MFAQKLGKLRVLLFSGGEPFLRDDLPEVIKVIYTCTACEEISIPTNGIVTEKITKSLKRILQRHYHDKILFSLNLSIDGMEEENAVLRGRPDAFATAVRTLEHLGSLKKEYPRLQVNVNSVISVQNSAALSRLIDFLNKYDFIDKHNLEIQRPATLNDYSKLSYNLVLIRQLHRLVNQANIRRHNTRIKSLTGVERLRGWYKKVGSVGFTRCVQQIQENFIAGKKNSFFCPAASHMRVIDANADVRICELLPALGNLRDHEYNLAYIKAKPTQECSCTHGCFISEYLSLEVRQRNPLALVKIILAYLQARSQR